MISRKAYAKINLCLDVLRRREDGYHEVKMIMQTVDLYDELTFSIKENYKSEISSYDVENCDDNQIELKVLNVKEGTDLGPVKKNLIYRAARLVLDEYNVKTPVTITLDKHIPVAAGMAGGSTDAAAVFHGLNELLALGMTLEDMCNLGVKIGADVPYCIMGGTALSEGIGEKLTSIANPPECYVLIAKPDINVSTKFVYENLHANELKVHPDVDGMIDAIVNQDLTKISQLLGNVLENVTVAEYPIINEIKNLMKDNGALGSLMSGSGPTVFGLYDDKDKAEDAALLIKAKKLSNEVFVTTWK